MRQFSTFLIASGIAAIANIGSRVVFNLVMTYEMAILFGYVVGVAVAFLLNRTFVFNQASGQIGGQAGRFVLVNLVGFAQVWAVSVALARIVFPAAGFGWHAETIAHVAGVLSPAATSYWLHKNFSFSAPRTAS
jgi:putative flippase GtrA